MKIKRTTMSINFKKVILISQLKSDMSYDIAWFDNIDEAINHAETNNAAIPVSVHDFNNNGVVYFETD